MIRLFVALPLPEVAQASLAGLGAGIKGARWNPAENLHLTLRFIGDVEEPQCDDIAELLPLIEGARFILRIRGLGHFGDRRRARVLWAGTEANQAMNHLQARIEGLLCRAGVAPEGRKFSPHITLARLKGVSPSELAPYLHAHEGFWLPDVEIDRFNLYSSHLGHAGAIHRVEAEYPLGAGAA